MRTKSRIPRTFIAALILLFPTGCALAQAAGPVGSLTENLIYQKNCKKCHGENAEGRHFGGPSLLSEKTASASSEELAKVISNGKGHMPKYGGKLSAEEIQTLVEQIKSLKKPQ